LSVLRVRDIDGVIVTTAFFVGDESDWWFVVVVVGGGFPFIVNDAILLVTKDGMGSYGELRKGEIE
jgi:hypothetical protein